MSEPMMPEDRYDHYREQLVTGIERHVFDALRDMISSQDAEIGRQSVTINQLERRLDEVVGIVRLIGDGA